MKLTQNLLSSINKVRKKGKLIEKLRPLFNKGRKMGERIEELTSVPRKTITAEVVSFISIVLVFQLFVFRPQLARYSDRKARRPDALEKRDTELIKKEKYLASLLENLSYFKSRVLTQADLSQLVDEITNLGSSSNVEVSSIKFPPTEEKSKYTEVFVDIELRGRYPEMVGYLRKLETLSRPVGLHALSMNTHDEIYPMITAKLTASALVSNTSEEEKLNEKK